MRIRMRALFSMLLALGLGGASLGFVSTAADAQRYRVACVAPGAPACRTACGTNTHTVVCYAYFENGRCRRYCGRPR
jgi:hypothetical protein